MGLLAGWLIDLRPLSHSGVVTDVLDPVAISLRPSRFLNFDFCASGIRFVNFVIPRWTTISFEDDEPWTLSSVALMVGREGIWGLVGLWVRSSCSWLVPSIELQIHLTNCSFRVPAGVWSPSQAGCIDFRLEGNNLRTKNVCEFGMPWVASLLMPVFWEPLRWGAAAWIQ